MRPSAAPRWCRGATARRAMRAALQTSLGKERVRGRDHLRIEPRGLSRADAAGYLGVSASLFDAMVRDGRMPQPKRINSRVVWDRWELDAAFDALSDCGEVNPWDNAA